MKSLPITSTASAIAPSPKICALLKASARAACSAPVKTRSAQLILPLRRKQARRQPETLHEPPQPRAAAAIVSPSSRQRATLRSWHWLEPPMATRVKTRSDLHADDLYAWSRAQTDLLRAGRFAELDIAHLTLEIEDLGGAMKRAVGAPRSGPSGSGCATRSRPPCAARSRASWPHSTRMHVALPKARFATTARTRPPTPYPGPALTASTRSPATGCRNRLACRRHAPAGTGGSGSRPLPGGNPDTEPRPPV